MSERIILVMFNSIMLLIVLLTQILTPRITRKNILLGVKIPEDKMKTDEVKKIIKGFIRENIIAGIPTLIIISLLIYYIDNINLFILSTFTTFIYIGILFLVYIRWNKRSKELKMEKEWDKLGSKVVVVDTKFSRGRGKSNVLSQKWFLVPLGIIVVNLIITFIRYPSLPETMPTHWDLKGNVDGYMDKSIMVALITPISQITVAIILYFSYYFMLKSKQQINPKNPEGSLKKNLIFRRAWSIYLIVTLILVEIVFTWMNLIGLGIVNNMKLLNIIQIPIWTIIILASIVLSIVLGQGGDRLKLKDDKESSEGYDIDDDNLWKLGNTIYYNPEDPAIFVEKRASSGWTVNAGRPIGMVLTILPFIIVILTLILVK